MAQLPMYYRNGTPSSGPSTTTRRWKEFYLLLLLFVSFVMILAGLMWFVPSVEHSGGNFSETYNKFLGNKNSPVYSSTLRVDEKPSLRPSSREDRVHPENNVLPQPDEQQYRDFDGLQQHAEESDKVQAVKKGGLDSEEEEKEGEEEDERLEEEEDERLEEEEGEREEEQDESLDQVNELRRQKVREMVKVAWDGYEQYAWGENELKPIAKHGHSAGVFGKTHLGATIVDSLDTLYLAGLTEEFAKAKHWVENSLVMDQVSSEVSVFEFNIRYIGGLLSAFALSGEEIFKEKAVEVADRLMPAFNTPTGIPMALVNLKTGGTKNWGWASGGCSVLAEIGTLHLEFQYLTHVTGNPIYLEKANHVRSLLNSMPKSDGLYPNFIHPKTGNWGAKHVSLAALGDSFYEYLLKTWLITSKNDVVARDMYFDAIEALENRGMFSVVSNGFTIVSDLKNGRADGRMQHLGCFSGGLYALTSIHAINGKSEHYMDLGKKITDTCHESYRQTASKLAPEAFRFDANGAVSSKSNERVYILRPETVESYFVLWRLTHDQKYRDWGWDMVQALEKNCRTSSGYSGVRDVYSEQPPKDDVQQSFFIAETLKYLFLLFSDDTVLPFDSWVLNTEAHPLPILKGVPTV